MVVEGSPWLFRGAAIVLEEYDGFSNVLEYKLDRIPVWTRIQGVPEGVDEEERFSGKGSEEGWGYHYCGGE